MMILHSFDQRFIDQIDKLRNKYGEAMLQLTGIGAEQLDINKYSKMFFGGDGNTADKSIDANANVSDDSVVSWETELKKPIMKLNALYQLWKSAEKKHGIKRANKMIEHEIKGSIRIHDLFLWNRAYCWAGSLNGIVNEGMPFYNKIKIGKVKHFDSFINLSLQYICYISNQIAGAVALPDFFAYAEYFIRKDYGENWYEHEETVTKVNQLFQNWIYSVNFSWRSNQSPFTNLSVMDKTWLKALFSSHRNIDHSSPDFDNLMRVQKVFVSEMSRNLVDNPFTFPVVTACLLHDGDGNYSDEEFFDYVTEVNSENGLFNIYQSDTVDSLSSCCRLRSSVQEANKEYTNSFGAGGLNIGSHRVVTINLPQLAYETESIEEFKKLLEYKVTLAQDILDIHRETLQHMIDLGKQPLYSYNFIQLNKQFSTIGFIGMNETVELLGYDILDVEGGKIATEIIEMINVMNEKRSAIDGNIRNIEQIPGESAAVTFALKDELLFDGSTKYKLYSNQYVPLVKNADIVDRIRIQGMYDSSVGGGSILHLNLDSLLTKQQMKDLMSYSSKCGVVYFAVNYGLSQCISCGKTYVGKLDISPCHDAPIKKFLRVVGFMTAVDGWNKERRAEYNDRQFYSTIDLK